MRVKPCEDAISGLISKVDQTSNTSREGLQALRDKYTELSMSFGSVQQKVNDQIDRSRNSIAELRTEVVKLNDSCLSRLNQCDSHLAKSDENIKTLLQRQQKFEDHMQEQISQISAVFAAFYNKTNASNQHLMGQLDSMNRQTVATFGQMSQAMQQTTAALQDSFVVFSKEIRDGFGVIRAEMDGEIDKLSQQFELSTAEVNTVFTAFQTEVVKTFGGVRALIEQNARSFEVSLVNEQKMRRDEDERLAESHKQLIAAVTLQVSNLANEINRVDTSIGPKIEQVCNSYYERWKGDLARFLQESVEAVTECQNRITALDHRCAESDGKTELELRKVGDSIADVDQKVNGLDVKTQTDLRKAADSVKDLDQKVVGVEARAQTELHKLKDDFGGFEQRVAGLAENLRQRIETVDGALREQLFDFNREIQRIDLSVEPRLAKHDRSIGKLKANSAKREDLADLEITVGELKAELRRIERLEGLCGDESIPRQIRNLTETTEKLQTQMSESRTDLLSRVDRLERDVGQRLAELNPDDVRPIVVDTDGTATTPFHNLETGSLDRRLTNLEEFRTDILSNGAPPTAETRIRIDQLESNQLDQPSVVERLTRLEAGSQATGADPELASRVRHIDQTLRDHVKNRSIHTLNAPGALLPPPEPTRWPHGRPGQRLVPPDPQPVQDPEPIQEDPQPPQELVEPTQEPPGPEPEPDANDQTDQDRHHHHRHRRHHHRKPDPIKEEEEEEEEAMEPDPPPPVANRPETPPPQPAPQPPVVAPVVSEEEEHPEAIPEEEEEPPEPVPEEELPRWRIEHPPQGEADIPATNPKPGVFLLAIGQPRIFRSPGLNIAAPRRYEEFVYHTQETTDEPLVTSVHQAQAHSGKLPPGSGRAPGSRRPNPRAAMRRRNPPGGK